jgi:dipeptidyl aminopeptidase/acylaminoacyl peptidase
MRTPILFAGLTLLAAGGVLAQGGYAKPPPAVLEVLNAPPPPLVSFNPQRDTLVLMDWVRYPPIRDLARPMLRLAGRRIDPATGGPHEPRRYVGFRVRPLTGGAETTVALPREVHLSAPVWAPGGRRFAFTNTTPAGIELWVAEASGRARRLPGVRLNSVLGVPLEWMPDGRTLLCRTVPPGRGNPPPVPETPAGPSVQESTGDRAPVRTFQDLLRSPHDEALFEHFATAQALLVDVDGPGRTAVGKPALLADLQPSPNGEYLLAEVVHRPFSYLVGDWAFPRRLEIWNRKGEVVRLITDRPLADAIPIGGVTTGPRSPAWIPTEAATLTWAEALDGGDPTRQVPHRDALRRLAAPFVGEPTLLAQTQQRFVGLAWLEGGRGALLADFDRDARRARTFLLTGEGALRLLFDRAVTDRYADPGSPVTRQLPTGHSAVRVHDDAIFLEGAGASPEGDRPFLDRLSLATFKSERLWRCPERTYETFAALVSAAPLRFVTRRETPTEPPNYRLHEPGGVAAVTEFKDPTPQVRGIATRLVTYQRADGVPLSFKLYLPPGYREGTRLPTLVWAYPREFNDAATAGQVTGSPYRFTTLGGISHLFALLAGYAVLDEAAMPVVGPPDRANDTFIEQVVAGARAAVEKAVDLGVTDPQRVAVGGHSYGAFMTAHLLAHSDLFRTGIARSGAYNRTLTPFGFQAERRTLWEAPEVYARLSPFMAAHKINEPVLLIHGEADDNSGTFPIQSERLYHAIKGNGGRARYVTLPHEAHGYIARESVEHTLHEMLTWLDRHLK